MDWWIGTYAKAGGAGMVRVQHTDGRLERGDGLLPLPDVSFAVRSGDRLWGVSEDSGRVHALQRHGRGWIKLASCASGGSQPCFITLNPMGNMLAVANYGCGAVALIQVDPQTGALTPMDRARQSGHGRDPVRQAGPHAHCALFAPEGDVLFHVDLGLDRVFAYRTEGGWLGTAEVAFSAPEGSGPRHLMSLGGGRYILLTELSAELFLLEQRDGRLVELARLGAAPPLFGGDNLGGHLSRDPASGDILLTNRGHDSLARFGVEVDALVPRGWVPSLGHHPRHFTVHDGKALIVNEKSGNVALVPLPGEEGESAVLSMPGAAFAIGEPSSPAGPSPA
jgi:6-phosphogluconolactonase